MIAGHDIAMALRQAYWAMHRRADALLQPFGVTANQFVLLAILAEQEGVTQQELVRLASSDANTVRAMLLLLERAGLVLRRRHATDGRARLVLLTDKGRRTFTDLWNRSRAFHKELLATIGPGASLFVQQLQAISASPAGSSQTAQPAAPSVRHKLKKRLRSSQSRSM